MFSFVKLAEEVSFPEKIIKLVVHFESKENKLNESDRIANLMDFDKFLVNTVNEKRKILKIVDESK